LRVIRAVNGAYSRVLGISGRPSEGDRGDGVEECSWDRGTKTGNIGHAEIGRVGDDRRVRLLKLEADAEFRDARTLKNRGFT
jgi:hypothetical protein